MDRVIEKDQQSNTFIVYHPDLKEVIAEGLTEKEANDNLDKDLVLAVKYLLEIAKIV